MTDQQTIQPVALSVRVPLSPDEAFALFTDRMGEWWPAQTHSIGESAVEAVVLEGAEGGEVYEICADGSRNHWARVLAWEPPDRLVLAWKPNPERPAPTEVEVTFTAEEGGTRVELEHRGWERLGEEGPASRADYATGWPSVLGLFEQAAAG